MEYLWTGLTFVWCWQKISKQSATTETYKYTAIYIAGDSIQKVAHSVETGKDMDEQTNKKSTTYKTKQLPKNIMIHVGF